MGMISVKCPNCGANVEFASGRDYGYCEYCGSKVMQEKIIVEHRYDESGKYENYLKLAGSAYSAGNYAEAYDYFTKALEIEPGEPELIFRKALCAGYLSKRDERAKEVISGVESAFSLCENDEEKRKMSDEITAFVTNKVIRCPSVFVGLDACEDYTLGIYGRVLMADALYDYIDSDNRITATKYSRCVIDTCNLLKPVIEYKEQKESKPNINVSLSLSGLSLSTGSDPERPKVYHAPTDIVSKISAIRKRFTDEINKFTRSDIEKNKNLISSAKTEIGTLPASLRILHAVFSVPMVIAAVVLALIKPPIGLALLAAEIICYVVYLNIDKDSRARDAYSELRQLHEKNIKSKTDIIQ